MAKSQPTQHVEPGQQNTQAVKQQVGQQQQPIPQTKQTIIPSSEQVNQATSAQSLRPASQSSATQQSKQPVANQTNPQATSAVDRQTNIANTSVSQTSTLVESQSNNQDSRKSEPAQPSLQVENPPTSFPQPLSSQQQEAATKPATKTPTEVRGKKKQFQVQVLEEPKDGLPIVPVNTNVPQNPTSSTNVPQGTRVSPVQEVAATTVASQSGNQAATAQQILKSNTETSTENSSQTILPAKQLATEVSAQGTVTQSRDTNTSQAPVATVAPTPIPASTTQQLPQATPTSRPASPAVSVAQQTPSVASQDASNAVQQTASVQTSLNEEQKIEASASTKTPDVPQENIHVQSPISSHPPIHISLGPSDTPGENDVFQTTNDAVSERSQKSHNSSETEKSTKQDDMIMLLTSSIQTQTSFDKNSTTREQPKKSVERKAMEKSSSDEQAPDDSDGSVSSEKSYSRQSSDSHSAYDMDIPSAMNKNISVLQTKVDIEHWLNQVTMSSGLCLALASRNAHLSTKVWNIPFTLFSLCLSLLQSGILEGDGEGGFANLQLSREETDELKRLYRK